MRLFPFFSSKSSPIHPDPATPTRPNSPEFSVETLSSLTSDHQKTLTQWAEFAEASKELYRATHWGKKFNALKTSIQNIRDKCNGPECRYSVYRDENNRIRGFATGIDGKAIIITDPRITSQPLQNEIRKTLIETIQ